MTDKQKKPKKTDFATLWKDPGLGDGITTGSVWTVPVGKPKNFFRVHPDPSHRRQTEIYVYKPEGAIDEQTYIIGPQMRGRILEARPATLVAVAYRDGSLRLWPIKHPREGERDNEAWVSARRIARHAIDRWTMLVWAGRSYTTRDAQPGYAPDPDWTKVQPYEELCAAAFGEHGVIDDEGHPIYRELYGITNGRADTGDIFDDEDGDENDA